ncbi:RING-H2 finger protein ATL74-like [Diospyros lotus]|uniref:RING-H2 finger protein ATL74-like n=1 Tax=Diospyros lotus TaxID=55363 RepID=UPI00225897BB|nr:RING-H2 finger protein ATL74-like [Diospyros lotus]
MANLHRRLVGPQSAAPVGIGGRENDFNDSQTRFDTNAVIVMMALLSTLICVFGLISFLRCVRRCRGRFSVDTAEPASPHLAATGLKRGDLRRLPAAVYGSGLRISATECPICLGEFVEGEKVRVLPKCSHGFHMKCIDRWLLSHSTCPNCRRSLLDRTNSSAVAAGWQGAQAGDC